MEGWTGIVSLLSLLSANVEGTIHHQFPTHAECKTSTAYQALRMQQQFDAQGNLGQIRVVMTCVKTTPIDSL